MTLHQLRVFAKVAELQSFTEAAKALHLSQPSVSALIQSLVRELKYKLFERRGMKIALTPEGKVLLRRTQEALAIIHGAQDEIAEIHGLKKGKLAIGGSATAASLFLAVTAQHFKEKYPGVEVILRIQSSENVERKLLEGEFDLALMRRVPRSSLLIAEPYYEEKIVVIAPPNHPLTKKRFVPLELLVKAPLIIHQRGGLMREMIERKFAEQRLAFEPILEVDALFGGREAIKSAVASGLGIGFLSSVHVMSDVKAGKLKILKVPQLMLKRTMFIVVHKNRMKSPLVQAFITFLRDGKKP